MITGFGHDEFYTANAYVPECLMFLAAQRSGFGDGADVAKDNIDPLGDSNPLSVSTGEET